MSKYVREKAAAKSIAAYVVLQGKKKIATIQVYHGTGSCLVNVWNVGGELQVGRASGYGYDRFTAALNGLKVGKHKLNDHCGESLKPKKGAKGFPNGFKPPKGYALANWSREHECWLDCYRHSGMKLVEAHYTVIQAI